MQLMGEIFKESWWLMTLPLRIAICARKGHTPPDWEPSPGHEKTVCRRCGAVIIYLGPVSGWVAEKIVRSSF